MESRRLKFKYLNECDNKEKKILDENKNVIINARLVSSSFIFLFCLFQKNVKTLIRFKQKNKKL